MVRLLPFGLLSLIGGASAATLTVQLFATNICNVKGNAPPPFETATIETINACHNATQPFNSFSFAEIDSALENQGISFVASTKEVPRGEACIVTPSNVVGVAGIGLTSSTGIGSCQSTLCSALSFGLQQ